ncbi:hypothetical protein BRADI_3g25528v3 [Brachypodium distachyon]|uniref:Uncharacterized protein n=1 Tax=Brachypodium distachyon TaxID=15368 RepID=A0A2K2CZ85_BRADI|nr:hypothetical protein BRADI_3g25528v3 [Brachypodium distachyon]
MKNRPQQRAIRLRRTAPSSPTAVTQSSADHRLAAVHKVSMSFHLKVKSTNWEGRCTCSKKGFSAGRHLG